LSSFQFELMLGNIDQLSHELIFSNDDLELGYLVFGTWYYLNFFGGSTRYLMQSQILKNLKPKNGDSGPGKIPKNFFQFPGDLLLVLKVKN
jgi:hypothetical protein